MSKIEQTTKITRNKSITSKAMHTGRIMSRAYAAIREWS